VAVKTPAAPARRRADAVRNRQAVLEAARSVLAARGLDAPMDEIAAAAGVGVATVYRHFPNKTELVDAVLVHGFEALAQDAEAALRAPDPATAWIDFVRGAGRVLARDRVLVGAARSLDRPRRRPVVQRLFDVAEQVLARARAAGAIRDDVRAEELPALLAGAGDAANLGGRPTPDVLERYLDVIVDGLRAK
jgi:AcrR family transcriptional regulator